MLHTPDVDGCKPATFARVMNYLQSDRTFGIEYPLVACFFAYFTDLHRPIESGSKPDSEVFVGVYPLHTCLFNLER